jgi:hypothetical protein
METKHKPLSNPTAQAIFDDLRAEGYGLHTNKNQYAKITDRSVSAVNDNIAKGYGIPNYRKIGNAKNAKVLFSLRDIAEYLSAQTVVTA